MTDQDQEHFLSGTVTCFSHKTRDWAFNYTTSPFPMVYINAPTPAEELKLQTARVFAPLGVTVNKYNASRSNLLMDVICPDMRSMFNEVDDRCAEFLRSIGIHTPMQPSVTPPKSSRYCGLLRATFNNDMPPMVYVVKDDMASLNKGRRVNVTVGSVEDIQPGDDLLAILQPTMIWIGGKDAGITYKVLNILLLKTPFTKMQITAPSNFEGLDINVIE